MPLHIGIDRSEANTLKDSIDTWRSQSHGYKFAVRFTNFNISFATHNSFHLSLHLQAISRLQVPMDLYSVQNIS